MIALFASLVWVTHPEGKKASKEIQDVRVNLPANTTLTDEEIQSYLERLPLARMTAEIPSVPNALSFHMLATSKGVKRSKRYKRVVAKIQKQFAQLSTRRLQKTDFLPRNGEYLFAPDDAEELIRTKLDVETIPREELKITLREADFLFWGMAIPSKRLVCFSIVAKWYDTEIQAFIALFCAGAAAASGLQLPDRYPVQFFDFIAAELRKRKLAKMQINAIQTTERFWYNRGFRYRQCQRDKENVSDPFGTRLGSGEWKGEMFKCN